MLPVPTFTGADVTQVIPSTEKNLGMQKTTLREKTPLTLPFGTIPFNYNTDSFIVKLSASDQQSAFTTWLSQNYPAIPSSEFIIQ